MLRTPLLPLDDMRRWTDALAAAAVLDRPDASDAELERAIVEDRARLRAGIAEWLESPVILDAIHVASPDLESALHYWRSDPDSDRGRRAERSLVRYLSRMASRPTPFGLFAGNSVGSIADQTNLELGPAGDYRRFTRLDSGYLFALIEALAKDPALTDNLRFRPNTTLALSAGRWRYVEWRLDQAAADARAFYERTHHLVAVDDSRYVRAVLDRAGAETGATIASLAASVVDAGVSSPEQATAFIYRLIENQILLPELPLYVTGRDPIPAIEAAVREFGATNVADQLRAVTDALDTIDTDGPGVASARYEAVMQMLETLPAKVDRGRLLHVDLSKPAPAARLGANVIREITAGAELLRRVGRSGGSLLDTFRSAFAARYEGRQVPLLEALDDEMGVGFPIRGDASPDAEPLLAGLAFPSRSEPSTYWGVREATLFRLLADALVAGRDEIVLAQRDVDALATSNASPPLPNAYAAMVTIGARSEEALRRGDFRLHLSGVSGPSGANLLGRFCHADEALTERVREHLRAEEALDPDAVFAEVAHLAHPRAGNIVSRPLLREFEITYMGRSGAPIDKQIPASDLLVSIENGRVVLRSARLGRRIVPRLASAHAFHQGNMGVYHFLCALQSQAVAPTAWSWGPLAGSPFLPRVRSGRLILALARWQVPKDELELLGKASGGALMRAVRTWRTSRKLPRLVNVADGDNMLLVDLDNVLSVESFIQLVRQRGSALLEEVFPGDDELVARGPEGRFAHELVVPFVRVAGAAAASTRAPQHASRVEGNRIARQNPPGSEWMYAKIYSGGPTADRLLSRAVAPLVQQALEREWIDGWFFIRYADPEPHLRVRFHGTPSALHEHLLPALNEVVATQLQMPGVWRAQLDTYEREIERYGGDDGMLISERVFQIDSDAAVGIADLVVRGRLNAADRWRVALVAIELLIGDLGLDVTQRKEVVESLRVSYKDEHAVAPPLARAMSERFRTEKARLVAMLEAALGGGTDADKHAELGRGVRQALEILRTRSTQLAPIAAELRTLSADGRLTVSLSELASSHVHMSADRLLRSALRAQETVIYDFLTRIHAIPGLCRDRAPSDADSMR